ncbi:MAG TPA: hypothetical protein VL173_02605 [Vicinamibacterales bacterium]|nr:hypothetical protein [Vicinamibacterales bacterium]
MSETEQPRRWFNWRTWIDLGQSATIVALALSLFSFYRSYVYVNQKLDVMVTEVSYGTNSGELYMTVALSNAGNRDAAVLRIEPTFWARGADKTAQWMAVVRQISPDLPVVSPRVPMVVRSGGVEVLKISTLLNAREAEEQLVPFQDGAFLGLRVATMASDGNLYRIERPVARLSIDGSGRIMGATPAIHKSMPGFADLQQNPPGDERPTNSVTQNKQTPFVWAEEHYQ